MRDGKWSEQEASILVPGDIVSIKPGDIIPCDARLLEGDTLKVDQSALTGEFGPITKGAGEEVFSGTTCNQGEMEAKCAISILSMIATMPCWLQGRAILLMARCTTSAAAK